MPPSRYRSGPPLIGTVFADDEALVVLSSYKDIILSETGMHMMMLGPGDKKRMLETCRNIIIENTSYTETNGDMVSQIQSSFLYSTITDVIIMQSATMDHYVMAETEELADLWTAFEDMDSKAIVMIRTRMPCHGKGVVFKFKATMLTSVRKVREIMTTDMISKGKDIELKIDAVYKETALQGSHKALGILAMLHHKCRHISTQLRNTNKEPTIMMDSQATTELWLMTSSASEDTTHVGNVSSHSVQHVHMYGRGMGPARIEHTAYAIPQKPADYVANLNRNGRKTFSL